MSNRDQRPNSACEREIRNYLENGETPDPFYSNWPGQDLISCAIGAEKVLRDALVTELRRRVGIRRPPPLPPHFNRVKFTRSKLTPMVNGLFPPAERKTILALLQDSVVFLSADIIEELLTGRNVGLHTAWNLANIYLGTFGLPPLGGEYECIAGLSEETTCYVTSRYFMEEDLEALLLPETTVILSAQ